MKGIRGMSLVGIAAVAVMLVGGLVFAGQAVAQEDTVSISDGSAEPGGEGDVTLEALGIGGEGLGAWTIDISYDTSVISAVDCEPEQGGVCNPEFDDGVVRITGASANGLDDDTLLGTITFECGDDAGTSDLSLSVEVFADATIGDPQDIDFTATDGEFECAEAPTATPPGIIPDEGPVVGTGPGSSDSSFGWLVALLAGAGALGLAAGYGALRVRSRAS